MNILNQKIDSQDCLIEINKNDLVIKNESSCVKCKALEENEKINLKIEAVESTVVPVSYTHLTLPTKA